MNSFLIALTDRDKKILAVLAVIFVLVFIVIGALYQLMRARMKKKGEKIYEYLYELNKYKVISTPKELIDCVRKKESRFLYKNTRWIMRILIITLLGTYLFFTLFEKGNFELMKEALASLSFKLKWPKVKFWGMNIVSGFPSIVKYPKPILELYGYVTYVTLIVVIIWFIMIIKAIMNYFGRLDFAKTVAKEKFFRSLEEPNNQKTLD